MKTKIIQFIPAIFVFFGLISAPISYWCIYSNGYCYATWIHQIYPYFINPLYNFSLFFIPIALILAFIPRNIFNLWLKFAVWAIPLSIIFIASTPVVDNSLLPFSRDDAARLAGGTFATISLLLILWKWFASRHPVQS